MPESTEPRQDVPRNERGQILLDDRMRYVLAEVLPIVLPAYAREVRARIAAEYRAAAEQTQADSGEGLEPLAEALARDCQVDDVAPAVFDDARNIATVAYQHLADRLTQEQP